MPFTGTVPSDPSSVAVDMGTNKELREISEGVFANYLITSYEVRGYTLSACQTWVDSANTWPANGPPTYKNVSCRKLRNSNGGLITYELEVIDLTA